MSGSGTIRVVKRDRTVEPFDVRKLTASLWRAARGAPICFDHVRQIAEAIELHLIRRGRRQIGSAALFAMAIRAMRHVGLARAADAAWAHRTRRVALRQHLRVCHEGGRTTFWDKSWLAELARRSWRISQAASRIVAGKVESILLRGEEDEISRARVVNLLNRVMSEYGLADAVPAVRQ